MSKLSHLDKHGRAAMVDVSDKADTEREARAEALIVLSPEAYDLVLSGNAPKGDVLATARIAGIMAAKKTSELIPLCHPLALSHAGVEFTPLPERHALRILASAKTKGPTGVEMEALTAASVAALTVYDMVKAVDRSAEILSIRLVEKSGGKSGTFKAAPSSQPSKPKSPRNTRATPRVLMHEVSASRPGGVAANFGKGAQSAARAAQPPIKQLGAPRPGKNPQGEREQLRQFMIARHLRVTQWARSANVAVNELYGFLNSQSARLDPAAAERLAQAARTSVDAMLGRTSR